MKKWGGGKRNKTDPTYEKAKGDSSWKTWGAKMMKRKKTYKDNK